MTDDTVSRTTRGAEATDRAGSDVASSAASAAEWFPASHGQRRLWILSQMDSAVDAYVISSALRLRGPIQADAIRSSLEQICARHDVLRTYLQMVDGQLRQ